MLSSKLDNFYRLANCLNDVKHGGSKYLLNQKVIFPSASEKEVNTINIEINFW